MSIIVWENPLLLCHEGGSGIDFMLVKPCITTVFVAVPDPWEVTASVVWEPWCDEGEDIPAATVPAHPEGPYEPGGPDLRQGIPWSQGLSSWSLCPSSQPGKVSVGHIHILYTNCTALAFDFLYSCPYPKKTLLHSFPCTTVREWTRVDPRREPRTGERVPYVIVYGAPGQPLIRLVRSPDAVLADPTLRLNAIYYVTHAIIPPLQRCFSLLGVDVNAW